MTYKDMRGGKTVAEQMLENYPTEHWVGRYKTALRGIER